MQSDSLVRTLRCRIRRRAGNFGRLATAIGSAGALIGEIRTQRLGSFHTIRDIEDSVDILRHLDKVLAVLRESAKADLPRRSAWNDDGRTCHGHDGMQSARRRALGAEFALDGRSVNNLLAYPGILRGALDAEATMMTRSMLVAAAHAIPDFAAARKVMAPDPLDREIH